MGVRLLTTGQAAKTLDVTPDTVLRWIRDGRLQAHRTAGGHYRIRHDDLEKLELSAAQASRDAPGSSPGRAFQYCWEYYAKKRGSPQPECTECVVYRLRAQRCYEVVKLSSDVGHARLFCKQTCYACDYYQRVSNQAPIVLVVTKNPELARDLRRDAKDYSVNIDVVDGEYAASAWIEKSAPDFVIIDGFLGAERTRELSRDLQGDPRIPMVRVILAAPKGAFPKGCRGDFFAQIRMPFDARDVIACLEGIPPSDDDEGEEAAPAPVPAAGARKKTKKSGSRRKRAARKAR